MVTGGTTLAPKLKVLTRSTTCRKIRSIHVGAVQLAARRAAVGLDRQA